MPVVSAFLMFGNPLPFLKSGNKAWAGLAAGAKAAGEALRASKPDTLLIYSTQWIAVLDELWQTRPHSTGKHVDENWYDYGDLEMNLRADVPLAEACIAAANAAGIRSKAVNYEGFPIDTGTIVANAFVNPDGKIPAVVAANNVYHDFEKTEKIAQIAVSEANKAGKRIAVLAIGGLSTSYFDHDIDLAEDHIVRDEDDKANRELLDLMTKGDTAALRSAIPDYAKAVKGDFGMKHLAWILGATGGIKGAKVHAYGPTYGAGAAVVEFKLA